MNSDLRILRTLVRGIYPGEVLYLTRPGAFVKILRIASFADLQWSRDVDLDEFHFITQNNIPGPASVQAVGRDQRSDDHQARIRHQFRDFGHAPGISPTSSPDQQTWAGLALKWFDRFLKGTANGVDKKVEELGHDPYDGTTTVYTGVRNFPMLPEPLSTGASSLLEGADKLCLVIETIVGADGVAKDGGVDVHYDPANPGHAALELSGGNTWMLVVVAAVCFAVAAYAGGAFG